MLCLELTIRIHCGYDKEVLEVASIQQRVYTTLAVICVGNQALEPAGTVVQSRESH